MTHAQIMAMVEEKWGEYLEVLTPEERSRMIEEILLNTIISQQHEITFLSRLRSVQENFVRAKKLGLVCVSTLKDRCIGCGSGNEPESLDESA